VGGAVKVTVGWGGILLECATFTDPGERHLSRIWPSPKPLSWLEMVHWGRWLGGNC